LPQPFRTPNCPYSTFRLPRRAKSSLAARPRWEWRFFSSGVSSAKVLPVSGW